MNDLVARIESDLKQAMLQREALTLSVLRMFKSAAKYAAIEKHGAQGVPTDEEVVAVARKEIKKRQDSVASYTSAGRADLADKEAAEIKILERYLPAAMPEAELVAIVERVLAETGATGKAQMGAAMKKIQEIVAGRADNKAISALVQARLK